MVIVSSLPPACVRISRNAALSKRSVPISVETVRAKSCLEAKLFKVLTSTLTFTLSTASPLASLETDRVSSFDLASVACFLIAASVSVSTVAFAVPSLTVGSRIAVVCLPLVVTLLSGISAAPAMEERLYFFASSLNFSTSNVVMYFFCASESLL